MLVPPEGYILAGVIALAAVGPLAFGAVRRSVLSPAVWVALTCLAAFVLRPLSMLLAPDRAHAYIRDSGHFPELVVAGLCLAAAGIAVFWLGHLLRAGERLSSRCSPSVWWDTGSSCARRGACPRWWPCCRCARPSTEVTSSLAG